jgi:hypothetical protein
MEALQLPWLRVQHSFHLVSENHGEGNLPYFKTMLKEIGNIVVIGLEARQDRWKRCKDIFARYDISPVSHYCTVQDFHDTHRHYMKDFMQMLRVKGSANHLCFFEDDFELTDNWESILRKAWNDLPTDWDMLYLGANLTISPVKITDNLCRVRGAYLMHATILSNKFIRFIQQHYDLNAVWIIDEWYRVIAPAMKFYMTTPMISYQREDFSDFLGQYIYYDIFNNQFYKKYINENTCNDTRLSADSECRSRVDAA